MKKHFYLTATLMSIVALFSLASCQKEESTKVLFSGSIEKATVDSKTSINIANNTGTVKWESGDQVAIYDQGASYTLEAIPTADNTTADFTGDATPSGGPYYAIYPADIATGSASITLPAEQNCTDGTHFTAPMYAYSSTSKLMFKNLCGVLQLNLPAMNKTIASIELTTPNNNICGDFAIDYNGGDPQLNCTANGGHTLTLNCGEQGMDCSQGLTFYIYLPADDYTNMTFAIEATDRSCCLKHFEDADNPITIVRNTYYPTTLSKLSFLAPAQLIDGEAFSRVMMARPDMINLVFEYKSTRPASPNGLLSSGATPIYYTTEGTTMIVYTPAAWMDANPDCSYMFFGTNVEHIDFGTGFNTANVTDMSYMFSNCQNLGSLNLSNLNLQSVTTMKGMFKHCGVQTLNLSGATTSSSLINATEMFNYCENLSGTLDLSGIELSTIIEWWYKEGIFRNTAINGSLTVLCTFNTYIALNDEHNSDYGLAGNNHITLQVVE
jgi:surface protein